MKNQAFSSKAKYAATLHFCQKFTKAILSVGTCEAHGEHLATGTDIFIPYMLSCRVADLIDNMLVLPPITVGYSAHYDAFPISLSLRYDTMTRVVFDILESTIRNGINKIFIMNGHDGNIASIEIASRQIKEKYPDAPIFENGVQLRDMLVLKRLLR